jgi:hypothetical protein
MDFRDAFDLCVYELDNTARHSFIWPYLLQYSGVVLLRSSTLHGSRATALARQQRLGDYIAEFTFSEGRAPRLRFARPMHGGWPLLRAPLLASRVAVVSHRHLAESLQDECPAARIRFAPAAVERTGTPARLGGPVVFGALTGDRTDAFTRAFARAGNGGAAAQLLLECSPARTLEACHVVFAPRWPSVGAPQTAALAGMAAGKVVIVLETSATAEWPCLNPQTWQPWGLTRDTPVAVSVDPRDEEHSLALAIRRLTKDDALRAQLGTAARDWWQMHATPACAAAAWHRILAEAASLNPPDRPPDWPPHLTPDAAASARAILGEMGLVGDGL